MRLTKRPCSGGCGRLSETGGRCSQCKRQRSQQQDQQRASPWKRGYTDDHQRLRVLCFQRDQWKCVDCGWEPDAVRDCRAYELGEPPTSVILDELRARWRRGEKHLHGDHDLPIQQRPDLRRDLDNYRTRCNECHNAKTMREQNGATYGSKQK